MRVVNPYLNFPGTTEEAFTFYKSVFGGEFTGLVRFRDFGGSHMGVADRDLDRIAHVALPIGDGNMLMGTDVIEGFGQPLTVGNNVYISVQAESAGEAQRIFGRLSEGGTAQMPLQRTEWAELYGSCADRFGVQWMVNYPGSVQFGR